MLCNFSEATKCLGFASRNSLYRLEQKGVLKTYLSTINGQKHLYMKAIKGKTLSMGSRRGTRP